MHFGHLLLDTNTLLLLRISAGTDKLALKSRYFRYSRNEVLEASKRAPNNTTNGRFSSG
jgi:hypothetical protein